MFAENLRAVREARGLSVSELARVAKMHRVTLHRLERGEGAPRLATVDALATALGVRRERLLDPPRKRRTG